MRGGKVEVVSEREERWGWWERSEGGGGEGRVVSSAWRVRDNEAKNENQDNALVPLIPFH